MAGSFFCIITFSPKNFKKKVKNYHFYYCLTVNILR